MSAAQQFAALTRRRGLPVNRRIQPLSALAMKSHKIVNTPTATKNNCKAFATNQTAAMHRLDDPLEYMPRKRLLRARENAE
jgi:hypothetical protein